MFAGRKCQLLSRQRSYDFEKMNSLDELEKLGKERKQMPEMGADKEPKKEDTISFYGNLNKRNL